MRAWPLLLIGLVVPTLADGQSPSFAGTTAEVVGWNFAGFSAIPVERQERIVRVLEDLDAEVIAAVEVNPDGAIHDIAAALTDRGTCHDAAILDQSSPMNIGVLFKCEVEVTNPRLVPGSDDGNTSLRKALAADVRIGGFDFLLVAVHLKSNRDADSRATRDRQVERIAAFIADEVAGGEPDVLVVGDYNMIPGEDASNFQNLNPDGFLRFVSSEDLVGQSSHLPASAGCAGNLLDGFAIAGQHTGEYIEASLRIVPAHLERGASLCEFRDAVSDHLPLLARFRVVEDDDGAGPADVAGVRIIALLPNPDGSDGGAEQVTLRNPGAGEVSLEGWRIADDDGNEVVLTGSIGAGATRVITLDHPAMLNNDGDTVRLLTPAPQVQVSVSYGGTVASGRTLQCGTGGVCQ